MDPRKAAGFKLDGKLGADTRPLMLLGLCELRVMDDARWPWLILVPQRAGAEEIHEMTPLDQAMLTFETNLVAQALKKATGCTKINVAALGNIVRQLHVHVIARSEGDPGWPGPVWGYGMREPYGREAFNRFAETIESAMSPDPQSGPH